MVLVPLPLGTALLDFLGEDFFVDGANQGQMDTHVRAVTQMVRAYTRGKGFLGGDVEEDLSAVIVTASARLLANPAMTVRLEIGSHSEVPGLFSGWTLPELAVLHRYRRRTA